MEYRASLCNFVGLYGSLIAFKIVPLSVPAGENHGKSLISVLAQQPAISPFNGIYLNTLLNLSYTYLYPLSNTA